MTSTKNNHLEKEINLSRDIKNIRVLHIDDSEAILTISKIFIERYGEGNIRVDSLIDPTLILEKLKINSYDVIISDQYMSKINGFDVFKEIRKAKIMTPFILLTGLKKQEEIDAVLRKGVDSVFIKEDQVKELYRRIVKKINNIVNQANE